MRDKGGGNYSVNSRIPVCQGSLSAQGSQQWAAHPVWFSLSLYFLARGLGSPITRIARSDAVRCGLQIEDNRPLVIWMEGWLNIVTTRLHRMVDSELNQQNILQTFAQSALFLRSHLNGSSYAISRTSVFAWLAATVMYLRDPLCVVCIRIY